MSLPDPYLRNMKFDSIPEMGPIPPILSDFSAGLKTGDFRAFLDQYLLNRGAPPFLPSLKDRLRPVSGIPEPSESYNLPLINALVMYIGVSSVAQAKARSGSSLFVPSDPGVVALQYLATNLDAEGEPHETFQRRPLTFIRSVFVFRAASSSHFYRAASPLPQRSHPLVQFLTSPSIRGGEGRPFKRNYD